MTFIRTEIKYDLFTAYMLKNSQFYHFAKDEETRKKIASIKKHVL